MEGRKPCRVHRLHLELRGIPRMVVAAFSAKPILATNRVPAPVFELLLTSLEAPRVEWAGRATPWKSSSAHYLAPFQVLRLVWHSLIFSGTQTPPRSLATGMSIKCWALGLQAWLDLGTSVSGKTVSWSLSEPLPRGRMATSGIFQLSQHLTMASDLPAPRTWQDSAAQGGPLRGRWERDLAS